MDASALIFVALAVAWAVYLIPKARQHHDEVHRSRSIDRFSSTMRVLAHREPINRRDALLVVTSRRPTPAAGETKRADAVSAAQAVRREAASRATKRRRNVLAGVLVTLLVTAGLALSNVIAWAYVAIPVAVLVAWLVACRVMVKGERAVVRTDRTAAGDGAESTTALGDEAPNAEADMPGAHEPMAEPSVNEAAADKPVVVESSVIEPSPAAEVAEQPAVVGGWDPVPTTLPTYVSKPRAARRTISTIDLESSGVWSSGRREIDSALARQAESDERAARDVEAEREQRKSS